MGLAVAKCTDMVGGWGEIRGAVSTPLCSLMHKSVGHDAAGSKHEHSAAERRVCGDLGTRYAIPAHYLAIPYNA